MCELGPAWVCGSRGRAILGGGETRRALAGGVGAKWVCGPAPADGWAYRCWGAASGRVVRVLVPAAGVGGGDGDCSTSDSCSSLTAT
jgi:hypothetical protein